MEQKKNLLVTFPVDLGNRTLESNLQYIFSNEMDFHRFAQEHADDSVCGQISLVDTLKYKINSTYKLRKIVKDYSRENKTILFHGLSPALFSYGTWNPKKSVIALDWTRNLYPSALGTALEKNWVFHLQRKIFRECTRIICWTDAVMDNLQEIYGVDKSSLFKAPVPFLIEKFAMLPRKTPKKPRVLFVGGDLERKGGDILLNGWNRSLKDRINLTMMTNNKLADIQGINFLPGIKYGSDIHKMTFENNDILVLPTKIDGYPLAICEAAAAGLTVITTKYALGAKEIIKNGYSGYITDTPERCIETLEYLLDNPQFIDSSKSLAYEIMQQKFAKDIIKQKHLNIINENY